MSESVYSLRGQYAGFVSRLIAYLIDRGIILGIIAIFMAVAGYLFQLVGLDVATCSIGPTFAGIACGATKVFFSLFILSFAPLYTILFWMLAGQTPGKYFLGLRVYRMDGKQLTLARSTRRYVGYILSFLAFGLGFFWITVDPRRQGFHDKFANTCVTYSWDAFQNQRLINRMSQTLFKNRFLQNPEAFYAKGMIPQDVNLAPGDKAPAPPADAPDQRGPTPPVADDAPTPAAEDLHPEA